MTQIITQVVTRVVTTTTVVHDKSGKPVTVTITHTLPAKIVTAVATASTAPAGVISKEVKAPTIVPASLPPDLRALYERLKNLPIEEQVKVIEELRQRGVMPDLGSLLQKRQEMLKQRNQQQQAHQQTHQTIKKPGLKPIAIMSE